MDEVGLQFQGQYNYYKMNLTWVIVCWSNKLGHKVHAEHSLLLW